MAQPDLLGLLDTGAKHQKFEPPAPPVALALEYSDAELLELWKDFKIECFEGRYIWERQWLRNLYYILNRQWITYDGYSKQWKDKRMAQWIPRPVTNKCKEVINTIRAMFTSITLGVNIRPNGSDPKNVSAAATADELAPLLYKTHDLDHAFNEFDFWLTACGNAFLYSCVDYDIKYGVTVITAEECLQCGTVTPSTELVGAQAVCPDCGGTEFQQATDPVTGEPIQTTQVKGAPITLALSPLEVAFPNVARFSDIRGLTRLRWRTKKYFESHPVLKDIVHTISWQKSPDNPSLSLFKSLANHNDLGVSTGYYDALSAESQEDGVPEYEVHLKPTEKYPEGLVFRVVGDKNPVVLHLEETEALPGPLPYRDADGNPLFTFAHAGYDHVGGRVWASSAIDSIIHKQDAINRLDSHVELCMTRTSNPGWMIPKGSNVERMTGVPGLVVYWDPLTVGGNAKPERFEGSKIDPSFAALREQYLKDIEELTGTFDIMKGAKPAGVEAFSAMQLLVERSQSRFSPVFKARGGAFEAVVGFMLELEREFGPEERTKAVLGANRGYTFENFKRAQLQGSFTVVIEDGSTTPKTNLGMRAAVEHANALGMLNMQDPDEKYEGLKLFGLARMVPALDTHVQAALQKQQAFEEWIQDPMAVQQALMQSQQEFQQYQVEAEAQITQQTEQAQATPPDHPLPAMQPLAPAPSPLAHTPLKWLPWYDPIIHRQEFVKWANSDRIRELLKDPKVGVTAEQLLSACIAEMDMKIQERLAAMAGPQPQKPGGGAMSMGNSNRESTQGNEPGGPGQPQAG